MRARQALEQKMQELPPAPVETNAPTLKKKKSKKESTAKVAPAQTAPANAPVVNAEPTPAPQIATPAPAPAAPVAPAAPATPEVTPAPAVQTPPAEFATPTTPKPAEPDAAEKAREAMRKKMSELPPVQEQAPAVATTPTQPPIEEYHPAKPSVQKPANGLAPMEAPASSLPASKEQRLQQLLQLYRADQITPQEYHEQRAKILSEP